MGGSLGLRVGGAKSLYALRDVRNLGGCYVLCVFNDAGEAGLGCFLRSRIQMPRVS